MSERQFYLDVSLRDGGYLNDWDFSREQMCRHVRGMVRIGCRVIEVGYLGTSERAPLAAWCPAHILEELRVVSDGVTIAAMLRPREDVRAILRERGHLLQLVRIPCDEPSLPQALEAAAEARANQLDVCVNLTSVSSYNADQFLDLVETIRRSEVVDYLCCADSRGAMNPDDVRELIDRVRGAWTGRLGFHAHDNLGLAAANSEVAISAGCISIDTSLGGCGLGGGNADLRTVLERIPRLGPQVEAERLLLDIERAWPLSRGGDSELYRMAGELNLEQEWVPLLIQRYGGRTGSRLTGLPRRRFQGLDEVLTLLEQVPVP